jgi:phospholipase A1/A2
MRLPFATLLFLLPFALHAQSAEGWQACAGVSDDRDRLACFDRWASGQRGAPAAAPEAIRATPVAPVSARTAAAALRLTPLQGCRNDEDFSALTRFWELERDSSCGIFGVRSFRPLSASFAVADTVNRQPTSDNPANNATTAVGYQNREMRLQFSVRSKLGQRLLTPRDSDASDSLWFAYSQQSYWQLFTPGISRPFRSTDHEPELIYIHPLQGELAGWKLRYGGLSVVHHSNGQSLPYSRSWNRAMLLAGAETRSVQLQAKLWRRIDEDRVNDDNPGISDYYGRAELQASWQANEDNLFTATARHNLRRTVRGSLRLEWFRTLWDGDTRIPGGLQLHTQVFSGYGDTLLDFNRRRSVLSIGLSLAEW